MGDTIHGDGGEVVLIITIHLALRTPSQSLPGPEDSEVTAALTALHVVLSIKISRQDVVSLCPVPEWLLLGAITVLGVLA